LTAADGVADDQFGWSVSLSGDTALVGTDRRPVGGQLRQGAAYVFTRSGNSWSEQARLSASDGANGDQFGYAVAVSGATAIVGARGATIDGNILQGATYVFAYDGAAWSEQAKLTAGDGATGASFGESVAFDGQTAIVGAPLVRLDGVFGRGAAYVFTGGGSNWSEQTKLTAGDYENNHEFGWSVAVDGDTVLVGVPLGDSNGNENQGAAYVFTRSESTWTEQTKLTHSNGAEGDYFGVDVTLDEGVALVGAPQVDVNGNENQGAAYVFGSPQGGFMLYIPSISGG
ncbi:MAG: FG-GAP repeat protein, partial [Chloroflexota bacterium]